MFQFLLNPLFLGGLALGLAINGFIFQALPRLIAVHSLNRARRDWQKIVKQTSSHDRTLIFRALRDQPTHNQKG